MKYLFFILFLLLFYLCQSQIPIEISKETEVYNGKLYYIHQVKQGQTLYSIAQAYQVSIDDILQANNFATNVVKTGQLLRIPINNKIVNRDSNTENIFIKSDTIYLVEYSTKEVLILDSLLKKYKINREDFIWFNPQFHHISIVHKKTNLRLPFKDKNIFLEHYHKEKSDFTILVPYRIRQGETLYSIARTYNITVETIQVYNPALSQTIQPNQIIYLPIKNPVFFDKYLETKKIIECTPLHDRRHYNIALFMPFFLDKATLINIDPDPQKNILKQFQSFEFIQFYEGFLLAFEQIKDKINSSFTIHVYDVFSAEKLNMLHSKGLLEVDLIIGPFHKHLLDHLTTLLANKKIPIISPYFPTKFTFITDYPYLINLFSDPLIQIEELIEFICKSYEKSNIIITYHSNQSNEVILIEHAKKQMVNYGCKNVFFIPYDQKGILGITTLLNSSEINVIVNFSNDEIFVTNFLRMLFDNAHNMSVVLFGLPSWLRFDNVELRYLNHFNTHFFSSVFINYQSDLVQEFVDKFQQEYYTDPDRLAFIGYDIAHIAMLGLDTYGNNFFNCIDQLKIPLLSMNLHFEENPNYFFKQNRYIFIYEIINYSLLDTKKMQR